MPDHNYDNMEVGFNDLPLQRPGPPLNAWGQFGVDDELGRLNFITPEVIKNGVAEVKHGIVVNLKSVDDQWAQLMPACLWMLFQYSAIVIPYIIICMSALDAWLTL
jgi:hypothetical protein